MSVSGGGSGTSISTERRGWSQLASSPGTDPEALSPPRHKAPGVFYTRPAVRVHPSRRGQPCYRHWDAQHFRSASGIPASGKHLTLAAHATESGPWAAFLMPSIPKRARTLPGASDRATVELAVPRSLFHSHTASSLKISMAITGPLVINWISSLGNGSKTGLLRISVSLGVSLHSRDTGRFGSAHTWVF